jgi:hypothetical protein
MRFSERSHHFPRPATRNRIFRIQVGDQVRK